METQPNPSSKYCNIAQQKYGYTVEPMEAADLGWIMKTGEGGGVFFQRVTKQKNTFYKTDGEIFFSRTK